MIEGQQPLLPEKKLLPEDEFQQLIGEKQDAAKMADEKYGNDMVKNGPWWFLKKNKYIHRLSTASGATSITDQEEIVESAKDHLTGLDSRRSWTRGTINYIKNLIRTKDSKQFLSLTMIDLDDFKDVNDTYGHDAGDVVLASASNNILHGFRDTDIVGRYGGDEIVITSLSSTTNPQEIVDKFSEKHQHISNIPITLANQQTINVTQSWGLAIFSRQNLISLMPNTDIEKFHDDDYQKLLKEMIRQSDSALYQSKQNGRNQLNTYIQDENWII